MIAEKEKNNKFYFFDVSRIPAWFPQFVDVVIDMQLNSNTEHIKSLWETLLNPTKKNLTVFQKYMPGVDIFSLHSFWIRIFDAESIDSKDRKQICITHSRPIVFVYLALE